MASRGRRRPFGDRLEIERDDAGPLACGVLGPAAIVYALAQFVWPEPPAVAATSTVGGGMLDESRQQRLWGVRIGAVILGIGHLLVLFALT